RADPAFERRRAGGSGGRDPSQPLRPAARHRDFGRPGAGLHHGRGGEMVSRHGRTRAARRRQADVRRRIGRIHPQRLAALFHVRVCARNRVPGPGGPVRELRHARDHHGHRAARVARGSVRAEAVRREHQHLQPDRGDHAGRHRGQERRADCRVRESAARPGSGVQGGGDPGGSNPIAAGADDQPLHGVRGDSIPPGARCRRGTAPADRHRRVLRHAALYVLDAVGSSGRLFDGRGESAVPPACEPPAGPADGSFFTANTLIFCRQRRLRSVLIYVMAGSYVNLRLVPNSGAARGAEPSMSDRSSRSRSEGEEWTHDARSRLVEELFAAHRTALLQYLTRLLHSSEDAEEIVQETYIRLLKLDDLSHLDSEVRRFLFRIATNLARDRFRQRKARAHDAHVPYDLLELEGSSEGPEEIVDWDAGMVVLRQALLDLPPRHRQVFLLHVTENMSYRTIAKHLGVSTKTVERDLAMVLELCQSRLRTMESK